jgi:hypothetical protein
LRPSFTHTKQPGVTVCQTLESLSARPCGGLREKATKFKLSYLKRCCKHCKIAADVNSMNLTRGIPGCWRLSRRFDW